MSRSVYFGIDFFVELFYLIVQREFGVSRYFASAVPVKHLAKLEANVR